MSKLYNEYNKLKTENNEILYLFKCGIFFVSLEEDAKILEKVANLKVIPLNQEFVKCGFPVQQISKYTKILTDNNITFKIIDGQLSSVSNTKDFLSDINTSTIINKIKNLDMDKISPMESFNLLLNFKKIIGEGEPNGQH